ncbi:hypothetical protein CMQ_5554 [Grosmannia clavigera kw1407]|uniref:Uncharacterized protein n=1 Tax=Grosmannia clavigera (strain kw1407 / UAMH 11150) TaxID=655863 RepID=F0XSX5_GROCL|nr:uncharacterized protein CMQ_5554 [Grosmannia clavigera kw1407]EFW99133.1 hypothetical protein CMQ_5554 [Grosmannia clavigera kw1407]
MSSARCTTTAEPGVRLTEYSVRLAQTGRFSRPPILASDRPGPARITAWRDSIEPIEIGHWELHVHRPRCGYHIHSSMYYGHKRRVARPERRKGQRSQSQECLGRQHLHLATIAPPLSSRSASGRHLEQRETRAGTSTDRVSSHSFGGVPLAEPKGQYYDASYSVTREKIKDGLQVSGQDTRSQAATTPGDSMPI